MIQIETKELKDTVRISFSGNANIQAAAEIHDAFEKAVGFRKNVELNTEKVSSADISFLQLLASLFRSLHANKHSLLFHNDSLSDAVRKTSEISGFFKSRSSTVVPQENCPFYEILSKEK